MGRQTRLIKTEKASKEILNATIAGFAGGGVVVEAGLTEDDLEISLYHLNMQVLARVVEGDAVSLDIENSPFKVITNKGHLGDVPTEHNAKIILRQRVTGTIKHMRRDPPGVRIRL